ncbi:MAG: GNAT family N-acetyltransferase [Verrucomicrobiales bacterium]
MTPETLPENSSLFSPSVTTYLETCKPEDLRPRHVADERFRVSEATVPQFEFNRFLYLTVGAAWAWNERREWSDEEWRRYVESDRLRTFPAYYDGSPAGYCELHRDDQGVEIAYFGLLPAFIGRGFGGALLTHAIEEAWRMTPHRVWVHTCNRDHPAAIRNYQARGMKIYKVETRPAIAGGGRVGEPRVPANGHE